VAARASNLKLIDEVGMAQVVEKIGEHKAETIGGILEAGPASGGEQFLRGGPEVLEVGDVTPGTLIGGGVEFEMNLIVAADETEREHRSESARGEPTFDTDGKAKSEK